MGRLAHVSPCGLASWEDILKGHSLHRAFVRRSHCLKRSRNQVGCLNLATIIIVLRLGRFSISYRLACILPPVEVTSRLLPYGNHCVVIVFQLLRRGYIFEVV